MPAYNSEKYISEAIESILKQTFTDFEFIIINDGSTDNTAKIIREYAKKDRRIRFVDNKQNKGFIATSNECLNLACGEYIAKMDSDDISLPQRLEKQVDFLDKNPDFGMVGVGYKIFGDKNSVVVHAPLIGVLDMISGCAVTIFMARRKVFEEHHLCFNKDFYACEDYELYSRFIRFAKIANIQEILYLYRRHGNNISIKQTKIQQANTLRVQQNILNFLTNDPKIQKKICDIVCYKRYYLFGIIPLLKIKKKGKQIKAFISCIQNIWKNVLKDKAREHSICNK